MNDRVVDPQAVRDPEGALTQLIASRSTPPPQDNEVAAMPQDQVGALVAQPISRQSPLQSQIMKGQDYLERQRAAYETEMGRLEQMLRAPSYTDAGAWGAISRGLGATAPMVGNVGQMLAGMGGEYGAYADKATQTDVARQQVLTKLKEDYLKNLENNQAKLEAKQYSPAGEGSWQLPDGSIARKSGDRWVRAVPDGQGGFKVMDVVSSGKTILSADAKLNFVRQIIEKQAGSMKFDSAEAQDAWYRQKAQELRGMPDDMITELATSTKPPNASVNALQAPGIVEEKAPGAEFKLDVTSMSPEDREMVRRVIARYKANPTEGVRQQTEQLLTGLMSSGAIKQVPGAAIKNEPLEAAKKETATTSAKNYAEIFDTQVAKPAAAFADTAKTMTDFNRLGEMQAAMKNGKLKEYMAGEPGKWLLSFAPKDSDLAKGIANAQEAEKLSASMVNQILLAAKGVQTEGDAQRARSQVPNLGSSEDSNKYIEAYVNETARQLKMREKSGLDHKNKTGSFEGYADAWTNSPIMTEAKGSVKKLGTQWIGLTQYMQKFQDKYPGATQSDAIASWNKVK